MTKLTPIDPETLRLAALGRYDILDTPAEAPYDRITRLVSALLNVPIAAITLVDRERQWFKSQQGLGIAETPRNQSFCAHAMLETQALIVRDAQRDARFADNLLVTGDPNIRFYVGVPLRASDGTPIGALCGIDRQPRDVGEQELALLADLANLTMEQLELRLVATLDGLTGALRRGPFIASATRNMALARRQGIPLSCLMIDADHFKQVNDLHGHEMGDEVLTRLVKASKAELRQTDTLGRIGGEEFCVFLPGTPLQGAADVAERLREAIGSIAVQANGTTIAITASIGVTELRASDAVPEDLMRRADDALYSAKAQGRDRVVVAEPVRQLGLAS